MSKEELPPISKRISDLIEALGVNPNQFAEILGLDRPDKIYNILNNRNKVSTETLELISTNVENINNSWLLNGKGDMFTKEEGDLNKRSNYLDEVLALKKQIFELKDEQNNLLMKLVSVHEEAKSLRETVIALNEIIKQKDEELNKRKAS